MQTFLNSPSSAAATEYIHTLRPASLSNHGKKILSSFIEHKWKGTR